MLLIQHSSMAEYLFLKFILPIKVTNFRWRFVYAIKYCYVLHFMLVSKTNSSLTNFTRPEGKMCNLVVFKRYKADCCIRVFDCSIRVYRLHVGTNQNMY